MSRRDVVELEDELMQRALGFTRPFTIADIGEALDYPVASKLLHRLKESGDIRIVKRDRTLPLLYEWIND